MMYDSQLVYTTACSVIKTISTHATTHMANQQPEFGGHLERDPAAELLVSWSGGTPWS